MGRPCPLAGSVQPRKSMSLMTAAASLPLLLLLLPASCCAASYTPPGILAELVDLKRREVDRLRELPESLGELRSLLERLLHRAAPAHLLRRARARKTCRPFRIPAVRA